MKYAVLLDGDLRSPGRVLRVSSGILWVLDERRPILPPTCIERVDSNGRTLFLRKDGLLSSSPEVSETRNCLGIPPFPSAGDGGGRRGTERDGRLSEGSASMMVIEDHHSRGDPLSLPELLSESAFPEGRASFGRTHVLLSFFQKGRPSLPSESARGEAFRRKPPEVKLLSEKSCFLREPLALPSGRASFASFGKRGTYVLKRNGGKRSAQLLGSRQR